MTETEIYPYVFDEVTGDVINRETGEVVAPVFQAPKPALYVPCRQILDNGTHLNHVLCRKWGGNNDLRRPGILYRNLQRKYASEDLSPAIFARFIAQMPAKFGSSPAFYRAFEEWCDQQKIDVQSRFQHWKITQAKGRDEAELKRLCFAVAKSLAISGANVFMLAQMLAPKICRVNRVLAAIAGVYYKQRTIGLQFRDKSLAARTVEMSFSNLTRGVQQCALMFT